ncbi:hypothetical protein SDRG_09393 [Saprolegnia diclina VS20]|uniref:CS domain-containing protein n=1 Tax=Saprolegnia diclina (strain VS20) TaxID=1156394 RepID=T0QDP2_SAPDV|nr:hypothetical protein SDRG_09393 [Saprolegnia diclina VS20]EQC32861.1 hypothetical protein SDRG_09393 [Saprolegnia diclina VS20]|eukprot:XP_008613547.1 hypothetical protein SDRG_09393 [Saprolegnia diclina VS20]
MPLTPQYEWAQTATHVSLTVPLKGASRKDVDFYVADAVLKINFKPYVLLLDVVAPIEPTSAVVKILDGVIHMTVAKSTPEMWKELVFVGSKADILARRKASMDRKTEMEQQLAEKRKDAKYATEKKTLRDQMALEEHERQRLDDLKADEKQREESAMYRTFQELKTPSAPKRTIAKPPMEPILEASTDGTFDITNNNDDIEWSDTESETDVAPMTAPSLPMDDDAINNNNVHEDEDDETDVVYIPAPRETLQSKISFTPRVFPTPSRESTAADEEDWLVKNRKHLKSHKGLHANCAQDISETDPVWLKAKADDFYHHRDFQSARNAYAEALAVDATLTACLSNRAACHLHLGAYQLCADDCSAALAQLPDNGATSSDPCGTHRLKVRVLVRRGTAYAQLGYYSQAKADYGVALSMHPENEALQIDFARISRLDECYKVKQRGDMAFTAQDLASARDLYTAALVIDPTFVACLSNRAACHLALLDAASCVLDCTSALALLQQVVTPDVRGSPIALSAIPPPGSIKRREWVLKTLVRRGTAHAALQAYDKAEADFADALALDAGNEKLQKDLARVRALADASME